MTREQYYDFLALDAPIIHLTHTFQYFFMENRNVYKYGLAKKHFNEQQGKSDFTNSKILF